jgi:hypothetical protein
MKFLELTGLASYDFVLRSYAFTLRRGGIRKAQL